MQISKKLTAESLLQAVSVLMLLYRLPLQSPILQRKCLKSPFGGVSSLGAADGTGEGEARVPKRRL